MHPTRPITHVAGNLTLAAINISVRVKAGHGNSVHMCWVADDGCIYLQHRNHVDARAIERYSPQQIVNRYRDQPAFGWNDIEADLQQARVDFAQNALAEAIAV
jgi:hypothetical protein